MWGGRVFYPPGGVKSLDNRTLQPLPVPRGEFFSGLVIRGDLSKCREEVRAPERAVTGLELVASRGLKTAPSRQGKGPSSEGRTGQPGLQSRARRLTVENVAKISKQFS